MTTVKRLRRHIVWAVGAFTLNIVLGCATTMPTVPEAAPIEIGPEGSAPLTFTRLIVRVPSGTNIGAHYDGLFQIPKFQHIWQSNITVASDEFKIVASEHLKSRGYTVLGGDNLLFGKDESAKAEYQLGGTVQSILYNSYAPLAGNYSESSLTIEWQLYDAFQEQIVYKVTTKGYGKQEGVGSSCIQTAFLSALDTLLADSRFVNTLKKSTRKAWEQSAEDLAVITIALCPSERRLQLPENLESVLDSVIMIRSGETVGSGVLISREGWAITAAHLVSGLEQVSVRMRSGLELTATTVRVDPQQDVALIRLPGRGYSCLAVGMGDAPRVGSDVFAVGAPMGEQLAFSVTKGVVSGFREWQGRRYLQTDAALNPGNSGGPLVSSDGIIVGIVSWKIAMQGFEGLAFGVPVQALADRLRISLE